MSKSKKNVIINSVDELVEEKDIPLCDNDKFDEIDEEILEIACVKYEKSLVFNKAIKKCNAKEINYKRYLAKIKLKDSKTGKRFKESLDSIFDPIDSWPPYVVCALMSDRFGYQDRLVLAGFMHGNGFSDSEMAKQIVVFYNKNCVRYEWKQKLYKFGKLWSHLNKAYTNEPESHNIKQNYYYYCMHFKHMMYYDGTLRKRSGRKENTDFDDDSY